MHDIRIATAIFNSRCGEPNRNLENMSGLIREAAASGAEMICFPECAITGYAVRDTAKEIAIPLDSRLSKNLKDLAEKNNITILFGLIEKMPDDLPVISHVVVTPDAPLKCYRKLHLSPPEKNIFSPGEDIPVFETNSMKFGIQLCYDAHFPELSSRMAEKGVDAIFIPHASPRGTAEEKYTSWMRHLTARAYDNSVFIIAVNPCGENGRGLSFPGLSVALNPSGNVIAKETADTDQLVIFDLKKGDLESVRNHPMRYFFPNRRPDIYRD